MIKEIFILNEGGIGLFYQNFEKEVQDNCQMLASFFSAIQSFAEKAMSEHLNAIISGENKYVFYTAEKFSIVIKTDKNTSDSKIKSKLEILKDSFHKIFEDCLNQNEIRTENFNGFEQIVINVFNIKTKPKYKSSEIFKDLLGLSNKKINFKKILNSL